ncbi:N5-glutamine methyltransferase family protein [Pseudomonas sp. Leaf129]|uniref:N5-glutamine methyltransferase family protein n=1 Tax=Pseudomonas sp. Leaf129 TaxID=1736268 RepID=UPI0009EBF9E0|nr:HemK/PrmC family methyltransferase [Pseudomonas sp. Leaf129]
MSTELEQERACALAALLKAGVWDAEGDLQALVEQNFPSTEVLSDRAVKTFRQDVSERCLRIPLGHILGYADFAGIRFVVGSGVFVPRRQSMAIVQWVEKKLNLDRTSKVYDLCAGVGAIGLSISSRLGVGVVCVDKDPTALAYLQRNFYRLGASKYGAIYKSADIMNLAEFQAAAGTVDVVVSNPPYVPEGTTLEPEWSENHPPGSIFAPDEGKGLIEASASVASLLLKPGGTFLLEHSEVQSFQVSMILDGAGFNTVRTLLSEEFSDATGPSVITVGVRA